ncbi:MAG: sugar ABC transporter permease [Chloroflexota bacterium]
MRFLTTIHKRGLSQIQLAALLMLPALIVIFLITFYPLAQTFLFSLEDYNAKFATARKFVGPANYIKLFLDPDFRAALRQTLFFTVVSVSAEFVLGLLVALVIHRTFPGRGLVRAAVLVPWAIPTVISARMWEWMYNDQFGVINDILVKLHLISAPVPWLGQPATAMWAVIVTDVWKTTPFMALLLLAGLQIIPEELYEAAKIDGAGTWQRFRRVTLPLLRPAILVALIFRTLDAFRVFDVVFVLTRGASGTRTLVVMNQEVFFSFLEFGYGSAISVLVFVFVALFSFLYMRGLGLRLETA